MPVKYSCVLNVEIAPEMFCYKTRAQYVIYVSAPRGNMDHASRISGSQAATFFEIAVYMCIFFVQNVGKHEKCFL